MEITQDLAQFVSDYMQIPGEGKVKPIHIAEAFLEQEPAASDLSNDEFNAEAKALVPDVEYYLA